MGGHVLWEDMSYRKACLMGEHVLQKDMSYRTICLTGGLTGVYVNNIKIYTYIHIHTSYILICLSTQGKVSF